MHEGVSLQAIAKLTDTAQAIETVQPETQEVQLSLE